MKRQKDGFSGERVIVLPPMIVEREREDPLVSSLYITDIGYYPHAVNHFRAREAPIPQYVLIYCVKGAGQYTLAGKRHEVHDNQYFILPAGTAHSYAASDDNPWTIYWVHFSGDHASTYAEGAQQPTDVMPGATSRISERNNIFEEIFTTLEQGFERERLRYASSLLHHYLASMRYLSQYRMALPGKTAGRDVVEETIRYMNENIEKRLTIAQLSAYTGYSSSTLNALFRQQTGSSVINFFNRQKVDYACKLLLSTDMKVNQICHKVGIDDCFYFSRLFNKTMGISPKAYREQSPDTGM